MSWLITSDLAEMNSILRVWGRGRGAGGGSGEGVPFLDDCLSILAARSARLVLCGSIGSPFRVLTAPRRFAK